MSVKRWDSTITSAVILLVALCIVLPSVYMLIHSFAGESESAGLIPGAFGLGGYWEVFMRSPDYLLKFWVSLALSGGIVIGQLVFSVLAGYGFSRLTFPGANILFYIIIIMMLMPYQVTLVSSYIMLDRMGLVGSYIGLWLPAMFSPFGVFLLKQAFDRFPQEVCDAAKLDGANHLTIAARIMVPSNQPALAALIVLGFADAWNMAEQPIVLLKHAYQYPLSVFLVSMGGSRIEVLAAAGVLASAPLLLLFLFYSGNLTRGVAHGRL